MILEYVMTRIQGCEVMGCEKVMAQVSTSGSIQRGQGCAVQTTVQFSSVVASRHVMMTGVRNK